jgi:hypothetical protein
MACMRASLLHARRLSKLSRAANISIGCTELCLTAGKQPQASSIHSLLLSVGSDERGKGWARLWPPFRRDS